MSASYRMQYPDAKLSVKSFSHDGTVVFEMGKVISHVLNMADQGALHQHHIHGPNGLIVDKTMRDSYVIVPDYRPKLLEILDKEADTYWRNNFEIDPGSKLIPTLNAYFYYAKGNGMCLHSDDHKITSEGLVHAPASRQILSLILYCSNGFEGGEIEFPKQSLKISPQAGMLIMFPSNKNFQHQVHPITSGDRISYQRFYSLAPE